MKQRVVAFLDHEVGYRLLDRMLNNVKSSDLDLIAVVTTQQNRSSWWPSVLEVCKSHSIPTYIYEEDLNKIMDLKGVSWYFLLSWKYILSQELINSPERGVINLHYSLLPKFRGVYPVNWAIISGEEKTGVSYHLVDSGIDSGGIILQKELGIKLTDTARSLQLRLDDLACDLFDELVEWVVHKDSDCDGALSCQPAEGTYKSRIDFERICEVDLSVKYRAGEFLNLMRGMTYLSDSQNLYFVDPATNKKIYIHLQLEAEE